MEQSDFLTTAAQVAVGLAGFTGVASVFSSGPTGAARQVQAERLRAMIETALVAVIFALVPLLLLDLGLSDERLWRLASLLYVAAWAVGFATTVRRGLRVLRGVRLQPDRVWAGVVAGGGGLTFASLVAAAAGFQASSLYQLALLLQLAVCAMYFHRFFLGLHGEPPSAIGG